MKGKFFYMSAVIAAGIIAGCSSNSDATSTSEGYFIDSAVAGLQYRTESGLSGTTDVNGSFQYRARERVTFRIGNLILGDAIPDANLSGLVTPRALCDNNTTEVLMLRVLQSLDTDGNLTNGIQLPDNLLDEINETRLANLNESQLLQLEGRFSNLIDSNYDGRIDIDAVQARNHFERSKHAWENGERPQNPMYPNRNQNTFDLDNYPISNLSQELKDALGHMGNEERLAYDVYMNLYDYHAQNNATAIMQLQNIATRSEKTHVEIVQSLVRRYDLGEDNLTDVDNAVADNTVAFEDMPRGQYDIPAIQDLYDALYAKGVTSVQDALEVGCMVEVTDINDLDAYLQTAQNDNAADVQAAFEVLRSGSYNHYWAFDTGLKNLGVTDGCCSLGTIDGVNYCHTEYPQNNQSNGSGNGDGGNRHRRGR
jgi:hypothetical protein